MVFKRRDRRQWTQSVAQTLWPRGGWVRAFQYIKHRLRRLPGTPEQIARGIFAGAFTIFTPFFVVAAILAKIMRGSILAAILATFLGNPLTYAPIAYVALRTGHFLLGTRPRDPLDDSVFIKFSRATGDLWHNIRALFTPEQAQWGELHRFYDDVFFPWMVGAIVPGILFGAVCYYVSVPIIRAYQKGRAARLRKALENKDAHQTL